MLSYDYAVVRVVPRVERGEFVNAGVIVSCAATGYLGARIELDEAAVRALHPAVQLDDIRAALEAIPRICAGGAAAGPFAAMSVRERFHWLAAPRSSSVQTSPVHTGLCRDPAAALEHLMRCMVRRV